MELHKHGQLCFFVICYIFCLPLFAKPVFQVTADNSSVSVSTGRSVSIAYTIRNTSGTTLLISQAEPEPSSTNLIKASITGNKRACLKQLANNESCAIDVNVQAGNTAGTGSLDFIVCTFNGALCSGPRTTITVTNGSPGHIQLSQSLIAITELNLTPISQGVINVQNTGDGIISNLIISIPSTLQNVITNGCGRTLLPHTSCQLSYSLSPPMTLGNNILTIVGDNADNSPFNLPASVSGGVKCWGSNEQGQLGVDQNVGTVTPNEVPVNVQALDSTSGVIQVTGGLYHNCALLRTGAVKCWGVNEHGQLGSKTNSGTNATNTVPLSVQTIGSGSGVLEITAGHRHTCALFSNGGIKCWGSNQWGQLGVQANSGTITPNNVPLDVDGLGAGSGVIQVIAGDNHTCALLSTGAVKCWGWNRWGQLGSTINNGGGNFNPNPSPIDVATLGPGSDVTKLTAGNENTCALLSNGAIKCWGLNHRGQLGNVTNSGIATANPSPLNVQMITSGSGATQIITASHTCAAFNNSGMKCWGLNLYGQIGQIANSGTNAANDVPGDVQTLNANKGVIQIAAGKEHACALLNTGAVKCFGHNVYGQIGANANIGTNTPNNVPLNVLTLSSGISKLAEPNLGDTSCAIY